MKRKPYNAEKGAQLMQAKRLVAVRFDIDEDQWLNCLTDTGCRFVEQFASQFPDPNEIKFMILLEKPEAGEPFNRFWSWWRVKWLLDDEGIVKSDLYYKLATYQEIKDCMIGDYLLEAELLQSIQSKLQL